MKMTCDNDCTEAGWIEADISCGDACLHISHSLSSDIDGSFSAFCHDMQEMIVVNGWNMDRYELVNKEKRQ